MTLRADKDNDTLRAAVVDTGCGIAEKDLLYVFDRLFRADPSRKTNSGNIGPPVLTRKNTAIRRRLAASKSKFPHYSTTRTQSIIMDTCQENGFGIESQLLLK